MEGFEWYSIRGISHGLGCIQEGFNIVSGGLKRFKMRFKGFHGDLRGFREIFRGLRGFPWGASGDLMGL